MDNLEEGGKRFDIVWRPIVGLGVLIGFGLQPIIPFISPILPLFGVILAGVFYYISYTNHIEGPTSSKVVEWFGIGIALVFFLICLMILAQAIGTMVELAEPCSKLRANLIAKPSSELSDTYTALHCPVFLPVWHPF